MRKRRGFTLIEIVIVLIIVGIATAMAGPMMKANIVKAKRAEAVSMLGAIRTAERCYYVEHDSKYTGVASFKSDATNPLNGYIKEKDLAGNYYAIDDYSVTQTGYGFIAVAYNADTGTVTMNQDGKITGY